MKHTIDIEGLPEGWEPVAFRIASNDEHRVINGVIEKCKGNDSCESLIVKKKQPRRIVLEETDEDIQTGCGKLMDQIICCQNDMIMCLKKPKKYWRIVEDSGENDD